MKIKGSAYLLGAVMLFAACGDKKKNDEAYSTLTIEQHKEKFVDSGLEVVDDLNDLSDLSGIHALKEFIALIDEQPASDQPFFTGSMKSLMAFSEQENTLMLKTGQTETLSFSEEYDEIKGVYTFNATTREFEKTPGEDIVYKFPLGSSESNNGELSLTDLVYITQTYSDFEGLMIEQPTSFKITLKNGSTQLMSFDFASTYDSNGIPTSLSETFTMDAFEIKTSIERSNSKVSFNQSFQKSGKNILSSSFSTEGDYTYDNMANQGDLENPMNQTILSSANAHIAVGNYKVEGMVNFTNFSKIMTDLEKNEALSDEAYFKEMAVALNNNAKLFLKYENNNEIIAKNEFYAFEEMDEYRGEMVWDVSSKMKFSDDSEMDGSFFEDGIDELISAVEALFEEMDNSYGE
jgi:hypothetical protein